MKILSKIMLAGLIVSFAFASIVVAQDEGTATSEHHSHSEKVSQGLRKMQADAEARRLKMTEQFGKNHPSVRQLDKVIDRVSTELKKLELPLDTAAKDDSAIEGDKNSVIESLVRQTFQLQTQLQMARIERVESDLKRIKAELRDRQEHAEKIIANRVAELMKGKTGDTDAVAKGKVIDDDCSAEELADLGWAEWRKYNWAGALSKFDAALKKDPKLSHAQNGRGWSLIHMRKHDESIDQFKAILKDSPKHGAAKNGLGQSLLAKGSLREAEAVLREATEEAIESMGEKNAVNAAAWYGLVRTYLKQEDYDSATKWSERLLKQGPNEVMQKMADEAKRGAEEKDD